MTDFILAGGFLADGILADGAYYSIIMSLILVQIFLGLLDTLAHHEFSESLAWRPEAQSELKLHALRNFIYGVLFLTFAFIMPYSWLALMIIWLIFLEVLITLWDFVEEDLSRKLPATERILHTLLTLNYGAILSLLIPLLWNNSAKNDLYTATTLPLWAIIGLIISTIGVWGFALRDYFAAKRLVFLPKEQNNILKSVSNLKMTIRKQHILITGATGFVGTRLTKALLEEGHHLTVLTRSAKKASKLGAPITIISSLNQISDDAPLDTIINLAGEPVASGLWTKSKKEKILSSRLDMIEAIKDLNERLYVPPKQIITASAIGWYGLHGDEILDENGQANDCFTHQVCSQIEQKADELKRNDTRIVKLRIGLVLGTSGGALKKLLTPFDLGLGGPIGNGQQWMSWIWLDDLVRLIGFCIANDEIEGVVNATAPNPQRNKDFSKALAKALRRPCFLPVPAFVLKTVGGNMAKELLLGGQKVIPQKAIDYGFTFEAERLEQCFDELFAHRKK